MVSDIKTRTIPKNLFVKQRITENTSLPILEM